MQPLSNCPTAILAQVDYVLADIDDTISSDGKLTAAAYRAMEALQDAGLIVIPVTGRPAGWCDHMARMWPIGAIVGENGAFYFRYDQASRKMQRRYFHTSAERVDAANRLTVIRDLILSTVPGTGLSADQAYREADLAIDFCEDVAPLPESAIQQIVDIFEDHGAVAKVSSIHVNGWFGDYDKLTMTRRLMSDAYDIDPDRDNARFAFVGDSPNDAPMFDFFQNSVGVANVTDKIDLCPDKPKWITSARAGQGFVELAAALLAARAAR